MLFTCLSRLDCFPVSIHFTVHVHFYFSRRPAGVAHLRAAVCAAGLAAAAAKKNFLLVHATHSFTGSSFTKSQSQLTVLDLNLGSRRDLHFANMKVGQEKYLLRTMCSVMSLGVFCNECPCHHQENHHGCERVR